MARRGGAAGAGYGVSIRGYSAFRRGLRRLDRDLDKQLGRYVREIAKDVRDEARRNAPRKSGALQKSIKHSVTQKRASLFSDLPYAAVQEWGGTIQPKGVPIEITGRHMLVDAVNDKSEDVEAHMVRIFDSLTSGL